MMVPKKSLILAGAALALFGAATSAQSRHVFARYNKPLKSATLDLDSGTITRGPVVHNRKGTTVTDFRNDDRSFPGFVGVDSGGGNCKWIDAAVKGTGAGLTAGVTNISDLMNSIVFAYCSAIKTPGSGGAGGSLSLSFYEGYTAFGGAPTTAIASFTLTGLPGNSASSSFNGGFNCFFLRVIFAQLLCFNDGPIGYGFTFLDAGTRTLNPIGFAGTWPFLACTVSCSGTVGVVDLQGQTDVMDEYCPPGTLLTTFYFGTTHGTFGAASISSMLMSINEVSDQTATITACSGIPAAPDVLTSNAASVGATWTATVTSGFTRTSATSWSLFFGNTSTGFGKPTGFDVGQFGIGAPPGTNFGTNKAGRRALCNANFNNPSGCSGNALGTALGSSSSCSSLIPKKIGLICNVWFGQALVSGTIAKGASGGGNVRLTGSVNGILGTH